MQEAAPAETMALRSAETVMTLDRMGAAFQTRLSFMRQLLRRMRSEAWRFERVKFDLDPQGYGTAVFTVHSPERSYSLIVFSQHIAPEQRTDRVIAEVWDATFSLFDGIPGDADIERLQNNTPKQEGGRFLASELTLARANKSVRLFEHVVSALADGRQPDIDQLTAVGYLMRTTAVYGSGKFGCADRSKVADRPETASPFQAELLTVYLIRWFTIDLVNHVAAQRGGAQATELDDAYARFLGIGNSTGLGMAPFLLNHPQLINNWVVARESAIARVRGQEAITEDQIARLHSLIGQARAFIADWNVEDQIQQDRILQLRQELAQAEAWMQSGLTQPHPIDALLTWSDQFSLEGQEFLAALVLEPFGDLIDDLADDMSADPLPALDAAMPVERLCALIDRQYDWALQMDFSDPAAQQRFWYYSEDKLEPRLGDRYEEPGAELEMPLAIGRDVSEVRQLLSAEPGTAPIAEFLLRHPTYRKIIRRIQAMAQAPYGEIRNNLLEADIRPLDILRFKLAFFGASKFDPKSDLWTRINMYQGAPLPTELANAADGSWIFPLKPTGIQ